MVVQIPTLETERVRVEGVQLELKDLTNTAANNMLIDRDVYRALVADLDMV